MTQQIDVLRELFEEWLAMHKLDCDHRFYTPEEWRQQGKEFPKNADLVFVFENPLVDILDTGPVEIEEELQELAAGCGYMFEFGYRWNLGFYELEKWPPLPPIDASDDERFKDSRWLSKRDRILKRSKSRCDECGATALSLEVHRSYQRVGREPWQYPDGAFLALCEKCLGKRG